MNQEKFETQKPIEGKETLQQKLTKRKYHPQNRFLYWIYYFIMTKLVGPRYKTEYKIIDDINDCDGPAFIIWNHLSRLDHINVMRLAYPRRVNMMAGYNEFFRNHLHAVFKLNQVIPKKNFTPETVPTRAVISIIKQGGIVSFAPEGLSSVYGTNQPVVVGTGAFLKHFGIPVYYIELRGQYLTSTKICLDERYCHTEASIRLLYKPEDFANKTGEQIDDELNLLFKHDDYDWSFERNLKWKHKGNMLARQLPTMLYQCPRCKAEMQMKAEGNKLYCAACGNGATVDDYYHFIPFDDKCVIPRSPSQWSLWERRQMIEAIRKDPNYSFSSPCKLGYLPPYKLVKKPATCAICGEGVFTVDHSGVHYKGTKCGEPWSFDMNYHQVFSLIVMTDTTNFSLYPNGEYTEILPIGPDVGKLLLATEEMHRLHVNTWKNFPWNNYLYENLD